MSCLLLLEYGLWTMDIYICAAMCYLHNNNDNDNNKLKPLLNNSTCHEHFFHAFVVIQIIIITIINSCFHFHSESLKLIKVKNF